MATSPLENLSVEKAKEIHKSASVERSRSWCSWAKELWVSDVWLQKKVKWMLGDSYTPIQSKWEVVHLVCKYCDKKFTKLSHELHKTKDDADRYCGVPCMSADIKEELGKIKLSPDELYQEYMKTDSIRWLARELWVSRSTLEKHLHKDGIRSASDGVIRSYWLKPFVRKYTVSPAGV